MPLGLRIHGSDIYWALVTGSKTCPILVKPISTRLQFPTRGGDNESANLKELFQIIKQRLRESQQLDSFSTIAMAKVVSGGKYGGGARLFKIECLIQLAAAEESLSCTFFHSTKLKAIKKYCILFLCRLSVVRNHGFKFMRVDNNNGFYWLPRLVIER
jgi:hypothetical protein